MIDKMYMMLPKVIPYRKNVTTILKELGITNKIAKDILKSQGLSVLNSTNPIMELYEYFEGLQEFNYTGKYLDLLNEVKEKLKNSPVTKLQYANSIENDLIESYKSVFTNADVLNDLLTPIDFDFIKNDTATFNPTEEETDTSHFNAIKDIKTKSEYKAGKAGVGMEANALVDHVRGSMSNLKFLNYNLGIGHIENGETIFDEEFSVELSDSDLKLYLKKYNEKSNKKLRFEDIKDLSKIKISNSLSAILNAFVDIAKDPYITRGNWNTTTTNVGNMLLRAGVHPFHVNAFLRHPVLKDYINFQNNKESKIINDTGNIEDKFKLDLLRKSSEFQTKYTFKDGRSFTIDEMHKYMFKNTLESDFKKINQNTFIAKLRNAKYVDKEGKQRYMFTTDEFNDNKDLLNDIVNYMVNKQIEFLKSSKIEENYFPSFKDLLEDDSIEFSRKVLSVFNRLKKDAKEMKRNVDASTQDVNGFGSNSISLIAKFNKIKSMLENKENGQIVGFRSKLVKDGKLTVLGYYTNNVIFKMLEVIKNNKNLFFTIDDNIINNFDQLSIDIKNTKLLDEEFGELIEKKFISYIFSGFEGIKTTNEEFKYLSSNDFISDFKKFKESKINRYKILEELDINKGQKVEFITMSNRKKDSDTQYDLTKSWLEMLKTDREMAVNLIKYSYMTSGFNMNKGQFYTLIPYQYFVENNINSYLNNLKIENIDNNFIEQFYENNYDNDTIVPRYFSNQILKIKNGNEQYGFILDVKPEDTKRYVKKVLKDESNNNVYNLYKCIGFTKEQKPIYIRVIEKGYRDKYGNKFYQYNFNYKLDYNFKGIDTIFKNNLLNYYNGLSTFIEFDFNLININDKTDIQDNEIIETKQEVKSEVNNNIIFEEEQSSGYANRTKKNASADATIAFAIDFNTAGEKLTKNSVLNQGKKYIPIDINDDMETDEIVNNIVNELNSVNAKTLNIAGNGIYTFGKGENVQKNLDDYVYKILKQVVESPNLNTKIESIRTGGQTGIDEAGTKAGIKLGLKTLTLAPKGWIFRNVDNKDIYDEQQFKARFGEFNKSQQLSLFDNQELWNQVENEWLVSGRTKEDFDNMTEEERQHIIKNCL